MSQKKCRNLVVLLGDQLDRNGAWRDGFEPCRDRVWMAEVAEESNYVWSHQQRIALFLSAMRHMAVELREEGISVEYTPLEEADSRATLTSLLRSYIESIEVEKVIMTRPGEWRLFDRFKKFFGDSDLPVQWLEDRHFYNTPEQFGEWAKGRKSLRMEFFYRTMRKQEGILMEENGEPVGGEWNFDRENRKSFSRKGPDEIRVPYQPQTDDTTKEVLALVKQRFGDHPGELENFRWPVTPEQAERALDDFIKYRLPTFGHYEDAMWTDEPFLYHSLLSSAMNLKLLNPRKVVNAAERAWNEGKAPLAAVEGFIRQIIGWREYVRGVYWLHMPSYLEHNYFNAEEPLPSFYWTGKVPMNCLRDSIGQTLRHGYAHHIQRLMVTGLYALLLGVRPQEVHEWYLAIYVDAIEWVELPNTLGMSQYGDGGIMASKPYAATGKYIQRMSNYCRDCRFRPEESTGPSACPFTTLYWDFLHRNQKQLRKNQRMSLQVKNLDRLTAEKIKAITKQADGIRKGGGILSHPF